MSRQKKKKQQQYYRIWKVKIKYYVPFMKEQDAGNLYWINY